MESLPSISQTLERKNVRIASWMRKSVFSKNASQPTTFSDLRSRNHSDISSKSLSVCIVWAISSWHKMLSLNCSIVITINNMSHVKCPRSIEFVLSGKQNVFYSSESVLEFWSRSHRNLFWIWQAAWLCYMLTWNRLLGKTHPQSMLPSSWRTTLPVDVKITNLFLDLFPSHLYDHKKPTLRCGSKKSLSSDWAIENTRSKALSYLSATWSNKLKKGFEQRCEMLLLLDHDWTWHCHGDDEAKTKNGRKVWFQTSTSTSPRHRATCLQRRLGLSDILTTKCSSTTLAYLNFETDFFDPSEPAKSAIHIIHHLIWWVILRIRFRQLHLRNQQWWSDSERTTQPPGFVYLHPLQCTANRYGTMT